MRPLGILLLSAAPFLLASCANFDEQEIYLFHDRDRDELHLLLLYRGLYHTGDDRESLEQLEGFRPKDAAPAAWSVAVADHWIGHVSKDDLETLAGRANATPAERAWARTLAANVEVTNGRFYRDSGKRLCGYQRVVVKRVSKVLEATNRLLSEDLPEAARQMTKPFALNGRSVRAIERAARAGHAWLSLEGQSLRFTLPMDAEDCKRWKAGLLDRLRELDPGVGAFLAENDLSLTREGGRVTIALGDAKAEGPVRILSKPREGKYRESLGEAVERKYGIDPALREDAIVDRFATDRAGEDRARKLESLIRDLGDDDVEIRERATSELRGMGAFAAPWLRRAARLEKGEARARAEELLGELDR